MSPKWARLSPKQFGSFSKYSAIPSSIHSGTVPKALCNITPTIRLDWFDVVHYTQDDLVNWYLFSDNLQKGILEFCGNAGSAQDTKFKCKGASIASGDSGSAVFQNDKIIAITSTVSVLPDRVWSSATLVSHPGGQKFFCAALARGFVLSWAHVDNSTARLACP